MLEALQHPPCVVQFSGGRDSSAILAVAVGLARRAGLPLPVPQTIIFPGGGESREDDWQLLVIRHLGLTDWVRVDAGEDADLLGPAAQEVLLRHGVIWSPVLATRWHHMALAAGGSLVSGEGGDEVLGPRRPTRVSTLLRTRSWRVGARMVRGTLADIAPRPVRVGRWKRRFASGLGLEWLCPDVREDYLLRSAEQWSAEPFAWPHAVQWVTSCRHASLGKATTAALAAEAGAGFCAPFLDPRFLGSLPGAFGPLGPPGRTAAMQALFGSLLPPEVISRTTKAVFTVPAWGPRARDFVSAWDGKGLDATLVDADALRRHWARPRPSAMTFCLLHAAWLAGQS